MCVCRRTPRGAMRGSRHTEMQVDRQLDTWLGRCKTSRAPTSAHARTHARTNTVAAMLAQLLLHTLTKLSSWRAVSSTSDTGVMEGCKHSLGGRGASPAAARWLGASSSGRRAFCLKGGAAAAARASPAATSSRLGAPIWSVPQMAHRPGNTWGMALRCSWCCRWGWMGGWAGRCGAEGMQDELAQARRHAQARLHDAAGLPRATGSAPTTCTPSPCPPWPPLPPFPPPSTCLLLPGPRRLVQHVIQRAFGECQRCLPLHLAHSQ